MSKNTTLSAARGGAAAALPPIAPAPARSTSRLAASAKRRAAWAMATRQFRCCPGVLRPWRSRPRLLLGGA